MDQTIDTLKVAVAQSYDDIPISSLPTLDRSVDVFENNRGSTVIILKDKAHIGGEARVIRRAFLRLNHAVDYRNVGWVLDSDSDECMLCGVQFGLFQRRTHCRVCGDLVCKACCTSTVQLKEFKEWGYLPACDFCYYGQVSHMMRDSFFHCCCEYVHTIMCLTVHWEI